VEPNPQVQKILTDLKYDFREFTIEHFANWIEKAKGRKILLIPWLMPSGLFGAWMSDGEIPQGVLLFSRECFTSP